jgi:hypothetical protein
MVSLAATPVAFLLPSRSIHVSAGKLALISMLFTEFFLFTSSYNFAGGASHFPTWALAIVHGTTISIDLAQRDVGFPLLYVLSGYTYLHSFIGITLIYATFAVLMPVLVYLSLVWASPAIAFYTGLASILSLAPYTYIKFLYHDQGYIFFNILTVAFLVAFLFHGRALTLIAFTLAALAATYTRTAGNLLFPPLLVIAYASVRGSIRPYVTAFVFFLLGVGLNQWHRYEVFDMRHQPYYPSSFGMQFLYSTYVFGGDFGAHLSPTFGPNTKHLLEVVRQELQPNVRQSPLIARTIPGDPPEFLEKYIYAYTPDELVEKIADQPNEEYFYLLYGAVPNDDQFYVRVAGEIVRANPWAVVEFSLRNLWHSIFDPGYSSPRWSVIGFSKNGNEFVPATGTNPLSDGSAGQPPPGIRELHYDPLHNNPVAVQRIFFGVQTFWTNHFATYVLVTSILIVIAWICALGGLVCWAFPGSSVCRTVKTSGANKLTAPIIAVSALMLYEDLITSVFGEPLYRYFHMTELYRLVIAGYGIAFVGAMLPLLWQTKSLEVGNSTDLADREGIIGQIQKNDLLDRFFGPRRYAWIVSLAAVNAILFAWWTSSTMAHTWYP